MASLHKILLLYVASGLLAATPALAQSSMVSVAEGASLFSQRCAMCHTVDPAAAHGIGPNLAGVVGRGAASTDFSYSTALKSSGLLWGRMTLDRFLTAPATLVPGTRMVTAVHDAKERASIIAYLSRPK